MIDRTVPFRPNFQRDWFISFHRHAPLLQVMGFFFLRLLAEFFILSSIGQILAELFFWFFFVQLHPSRGTGHQNGPILRIKNQIKRNKRGPPPRNKKRLKIKTTHLVLHPFWSCCVSSGHDHHGVPKKKKKKSDKASTYHHDTKRRKPVKVNVFLSVDSLLFCFFFIRWSRGSRRWPKTPSPSSSSSSSSASSGVSWSTPPPAPVATCG